MSVRVEAVLTQKEIARVLHQAVVLWMSAGIIMMMFAGTTVNAQSAVLTSCCHERHCCASFVDGTAKCWGNNYNGQLGLGDSDDRGGSGAGIVDANLGDGSVVGVACGGHHSCVLLNGGSIKCFGLNSDGQLGLGDTVDRGQLAKQMGEALPEVDLGTGQAAAYVACGLYHSCAILENGSLKCWGANSVGQLGLGDNQDRGDALEEMGENLPEVDLNGKAVSVSCGEYHTCVLVEGGFVKCFGYNDEGQLGQGDTDYRGNSQLEMGSNLPALDLKYSPGLVKAVDSLACGGHHCCVAIDGAVKCWGYNLMNGRLGYEDVEHRGDDPGEMGALLPLVDLGSDFVASSVSCGKFHTCVVETGGSVKCFGSNDDGQLGQGDSNDRGSSPGTMGENLAAVDLGTGEKASGIVCGGYHTCAILEGGAIKCWGRNDKGQLGLGDETYRGMASGEMGDSLPRVQFTSQCSGCSVYAGCIQVAGAYECSCSPGYEQQGDGTTGDCIEIDECETRVHNCDASQLCSNTAGSFACDASGAGEDCSAGSHDCDVHATCYKFSSKTETIACLCDRGYSQKSDGTTGDCQDLDECSIGKHTCKAPILCTNTEGSFVCGPSNECTSSVHNCDSLATCSVTAGSFECECKRGYEQRRDGTSGDCFDIDECATGAHDCKGDSECSNSEGSFSCTCTEEQPCRDVLNSSRKLNCHDMRRCNTLLITLIILVFSYENNSC